MAFPSWFAVVVVALGPAWLTGSGFAEQDSQPNNGLAIPALMGFLATPRA